MGAIEAIGGGGGGGGAAGGGGNRARGGGAGAEGGARARAGWARVPVPRDAPARVVPCSGRPLPATPGQPQPCAPAVGAARPPRRAARTNPNPNPNARQERIARKIAIEKERLRLLKQLDDFQEP